VSLKVLIALARGDLERASAEIGKAGRQIDPVTLLSFFAYYQDLYWALDDQQQRQVLGFPVSAFDDDRGGWALVRTGLYQLRGDRHRMLVYADSARLAFEQRTREAPEDGQRRVLLGLALAYLGRKEEAVREGQRGVELMPIARDGYIGPYVQLQLVRIYLLVGEPEKALDQLEPLLRIPFYLSPGWLRIDPTFDPLRADPRFRNLVGSELPRRAVGLGTSSQHLVQRQRQIVRSGAGTPQTMGRSGWPSAVDLLVMTRVDLGCELGDLIA
jgi:PAS domain-containing protein